VTAKLTKGSTSMKTAEGKVNIVNVPISMPYVSALFANPNLGRPRSCLEVCAMTLEFCPKFSR
jgi:hypothetical protein